MTSFDSFGLAEPIARALVDENYVTPTPVQAAAIPVVLAGRDLIGIAQTGTGKTAAFALPILHKLATNPIRREPKTCRVLVLSPTRELSGQIVDSFESYGRRMRVSVTLAIGGVPIGRQVRALAQGVDVLVATPGRLVDLCRIGALRLDRVDTLVLDEADRMLDMGFVHAIRAIVAKLPRDRQSLFFSATMPGEIAELAAQMLNNPAQVAVTPVATTAERIDQRIIRIDKAEKTALLTAILTNEPIDRALVFSRTKHGADKIVRNLALAGINADAIHGNKSQVQRDRALGNFRDGRTRVLIATDIAARGIDVSGITHVINFDLPNEPESYVHRIGRTARAGAEGIAISFCDSEEVAYLRAIERTIRMTLPMTDRHGNPMAPREPRQDGPRRPQQNRGPRPAFSGKPRSEYQGDRPHAPREHAARDHAPREHAPREHVRPDHVQRDGVEQPRRPAPHHAANHADPRPQPARPNQQRPQQGRPGGPNRNGKPAGDRPQGDRPFGERNGKPRGDFKPRSDAGKPRGEMSGVPFLRAR